MRLLVFFILLSFVGKAQIDSAQAIPLVGINLGGQLPGGDLASRFGPNLSLGLGFMYKTKKNWIYGIAGNYMFGRNVREDVVSNLKTSTGYVVDNAGYQADLRITERGLGVHLQLGKVLNVANTNPNSGLMVIIGAGVLQHKVNLYDGQQQIAAIKGSMRYGYDRLTLGFSISEFVGYLFLSENKLLNFYVGVEGVQAVTKSLRKVNYDTGLPDTRRRLDMLTGLRLGWILPLYKRKPRDFYYN